MTRFRRVLLSFLPLLIASAGAALIYPPAGLIVLGGAWYAETRFGK